MSKDQKIGDILLQKTDYRCGYCMRNITPRFYKFSEEKGKKKDSPYPFDTVIYNIHDRAHIEPNSVVNDGFKDFYNLIALCPSCHREIDRGALGNEEFKKLKLHWIVASGRITRHEIECMKSMQDSLNVKPKDFGNIPGIEWQENPKESKECNEIIKGALEQWWLSIKKRWIETEREEMAQIKARVEDRKTEGFDSEGTCRAIIGPLCHKTDTTGWTNIKESSIPDDYKSPEEVWEEVEKALENDYGEQYWKIHLPKTILQYNPNRATEKYICETYQYRGKEILERIIEEEEKDINGNTGGISRNIRGISLQRYGLQMARVPESLIVKRINIENEKVSEYLKGKGIDKQNIEFWVKANLGVQTTIPVNIYTAHLFATSRREGLMEILTVENEKQENEKKENEKQENKCYIVLTEKGEDFCKKLV